MIKYMCIWKAVIFLVIFILLVIVIKHGYAALKEKFLYGAVNKSLQAYCKKKFSAELSIGKISGNLFTNLYLEEIQLGNIKGLPQRLKLKAESIRFRYTPIDIITHNPAVWIEGLEVIYANINLPISCHQHNKAVTLILTKRNINFNQVERLGNEDLAFKGLCTIRGFIVLERLKPKTLDVQIESDNLSISYADSLKGNINTILKINGDFVRPHIKSYIHINEITYTGELDKIKAASLSAMGIADNLFLDITIKGSDIRLKNQALDAVLRVDLQFKAESRKKPYLIGKVESTYGAYVAYQNKFKLTKGEIIFPGDSEKEAKMDIKARTKIKRYSIFATIRGNLDESYIELNSKPPLSRDEIISLLIFGKKIDDLDIEQRSEFLNARAVTESFVSRLFLGKAQAKISEAMRIDDLAIEFDSVSSLKGPQISSVEVGKCIDKEGKLYGTYRFEASQVSGQKPSQTIGTEYAVTDNVLVKGEHNYTESIKLPQEDKLCVEFQWKF